VELAYDKMQDYGPFMPNSPHDRIARRLKTLREERKLTQTALAEQMGFNHRQTLASIESGDRSVTPEELVGAARALDVELEAFTDPFRLVGEGRFSFRVEGVAPQALDRFECQAGQWVATYRTLLERAGVFPSQLGRKLELTAHSSFEAAQAAAEEIRVEWKLGEVPADDLSGAIERELGAQILFVDAPQGVSGAVVHLPGLHTILVNREEPAGRRHFDMAHELFHLLTWDAMTPDRVEPLEVPPKKGNRAERLAENFAGALLMPAGLVATRWHRRGDTDPHDWLNATATSLRVTSVALKWRLVVLRLLPKSLLKALDNRRLVANGGVDEEGPPLPFNREFVTRVWDAVEAGYLSLRRATRLLGLPVDDFADLCQAYGLELSYEV